MTLGDRIRQARIEANLSQEDLGKLIGIRSRSALSKWESGKVKPEQDTLRLLATALGKPLAWFGEMSVRDGILDLVGAEEDALALILSPEPDWFQKTLDGLTTSGSRAVLRLGSIFEEITETDFIDEVDFGVFSEGLKSAIKDAIGETGRPAYLSHNGLSRIISRLKDPSQEGAVRQELRVLWESRRMILPRLDELWARLDRIESSLAKVSSHLSLDLDQEDRAR